VYGSNCLLHCGSYCLSGGRLFRATPTGRACRARSLGAAKTDSPAGSFAELFKKRSGGGGVGGGSLLVKKKINR